MAQDMKAYAAYLQAQKVAETALFATAASDENTRLYYLNKLSEDAHRLRRLVIAATIHVTTANTEIGDIVNRVAALAEGKVS